MTNYEPMDDMTPEEAAVDAQLRAATKTLRAEVETISPPAFERVESNKLYPVLAAAAVVLGVAFGGWRLLSDRTVEIDTSPADTSQTSEQTETTQPAPTDETPFTPIVSNGEPVDTPAEFNLPTTHSLEVEMLRVEVGQVGQPISLPEFGTTVRRLTDASEDEGIGALSPSAFNLDESLAILYSTNRGQVLYDVANFQSLGPVDISPADIEQVYWSRTNSNIIHYLEKGTANFMAYDVTTKASTVVHSFKDCTTVNSGKAPTAPSGDGQVWGLICYHPAGQDLVSFNLTTREEVRAPITEQTDGLYPALSGNMFVQVPDSGDAIVLDANLQPTGVTFPVVAPAMTTDAQGNDAAATALYNDAPVGNLIMFSLATGNATPIIAEDTGYGYPAVGTRISTSATPGILVFKTAGETRDNIPSPGSSTLISGEIVLIDSRNGEPKIYRVAHHRESTQNEDWSGTYIAISPSGTKVLFSSDWQSGTEANTFIMDLANP